MAPPVSPEAEDKIFNGLVKVAELVNAGTRPDDAIIKVAREGGMPAGHVRIMVNAFNTGRTNRQRTTAEDFFAKTADFELADAAKILEAIYPRHVKSAEEALRPTVVSDEYDAPPDWAASRRHAEKAARAALPTSRDDWPCEPPPGYDRDPRRFDAKAAGALQKLQTEREALHEALQTTHDKIAAAFGDLCLYFRTPGNDSLADVRANAEAFFGNAAAVLLDKVAEASECCMASKPVKIKKPKVVSPHSSTVTIKRSSLLPPMRRGRSPYLEVEQILKAAAEHREQFDKIAAFEKAAVEAELRLGRAMLGGEARPLEADNTLSLLRRLKGEKRSFAPLSGSIGQGVGVALGASAGNSIMNKLLPVSDDKVKQDAYMDLLDPSHESKLRSIRTQATLHGLMNSPYFEGEDPRQVTDLFNKVTKLSPRMADQPMLLESAMRRLMAQGSADPHDLDQLLGIEIKQKQRDQLPGGDSAATSMLAPGLGQGRPEAKKE